MKLDIFLSKSSNVFAENRLLKFVLISLIIITAINSYTAYYGLNYHRTIIIPPTVNGQIDVKGNYYSENYLGAMGKYITYLSFNYTPGNVRNQFNDLLQLYDVDEFNRVKNEYYALAEQVEKNGLTSVFFPQGDIYVETNKDKIKITVNGLRKINKNNIDQESSVASFSIEAEVKNGRFVIKSIKENTK